MSIGKTLRGFGFAFLVVGALVGVTAIVSPLSLAFAYQAIVDLMSPSLPSLLSELPANFKQASDEFDRRLKKNYPLGSPAKNLVSDLKRLRFEIGRSERDAVYTKSGLPCAYDWYVRWDENDQGLLINISASYHPICM